MLRPSMPLEMEPGCLVNIEHTKETVHPYILEDVNTAARVPLKVWMKTVLGLPEDRLTQWVQCITDNEWYKDDVIQNALIQFGSTSCETERYKPFSAIANRIFELAKTQISGAESYPIGDIQILCNDPNVLNRIPEDNGLGARRKPDLLAVRGSKVKSLQESNSKSFDWSDVLTFIEMKLKKDLFDTLQDWRGTRGLPILDQRRLLPVGLLETVCIYSFRKMES